MSAKHLHHYVTEFATRHNQPSHDTIAMMSETVARTSGKQRMYQNFVFD